MKRVSALIIVSILVVSCSNSSVRTNGVAFKDSINGGQPLGGTDPRVEPSIGNTYRDTLKINYVQHKDLLEILKVVPDSSFQTWGWDKKERADFVKFISAHNFTVDTTEDYVTIKQIKPNTIYIQVIDGTWTLSIYKASDGSYTAITDEGVGDSDYLYAFEYDHGKVRSLSVEQLIGRHFKEFLVQQDSAATRKFVFENELMFSYYFDHETRVRIHSSLDKSRSNPGLKGNAIELEFNAQRKRFEFSKVGWSEN